MRKVFLTLIRSAVRGDEIDKGVIDSCRESGANSEILRISRAHDLANIAASALSERGLLGSDEASRELERQLMLSVYRYERIRHTLDEAVRIFEDAKIYNIPLKGAVIRGYYPGPWMRTSCDVDILVRKEDVERAICALEAAGYTRQKDCTVHDHTLVSPAGVHLELHYTLEQDGKLPLADTILAGVWESATPCAEGAYRSVMTEEMFVLYHIAHMAKHFLFGGCGVRPFIDLWLLLERGKFDSERLSALLDEAGLGDFFRHSSALCRAWLDGGEYDEVTRAMEDYVFTGGVYGTSSNSAAVKAAKGESRTRTFLGVMFLPKAKLEVIYPRVRKYPILTPFYQVKRWFRVFKKDKRRKVRNITKARNNVTESQERRVDNLLGDLGLK